MKIFIIILTLITLIGDIYFAYRAHQQHNIDACIPWGTLAIIIFIDLIVLLL